MQIPCALSEAAYTRQVSEASYPICVLGATISFGDSISLMFTCSLWLAGELFHTDFLLLHLKKFAVDGFLFYPRSVFKSWLCKKNEWNVWDRGQVVPSHGNGGFQDALWTKLEKNTKESLVLWELSNWYEPKSECSRLWQRQRRNLFALCVWTLPFVLFKHLSGSYSSTARHSFFLTCPPVVLLFLLCPFLPPPTHSGFQECIECPYRCPCKQKGEPAAEVEFLHRSQGRLCELQPTRQHPRAIMALWCPHNKNSIKKSDLNCRPAGRCPQFKHVCVQQTGNCKVCVGVTASVCLSMWPRNKLTTCSGCGWGPRSQSNTA